MASVAGWWIIGCIRSGRYTALRSRRRAISVCLRLPSDWTGRGLGEYFGALVTGPSAADLIAQGYLSTYRLFAAPRPADLSGVHMQAGDYNRKELTQALDKPHNVGDAISHYLKLAAGRQTLLFAHSVASSAEYVEWQA